MIVKSIYSPQLNVIGIKLLIGSKYTGKPAAFTDQQNGTYWEVLPTFSRFEHKLQNGLVRVKKVATVKKVSVTMQFVFGDDKLPNLKRPLFGGAIGKVIRKFWKWA